MALRGRGSKERKEKRRVKWRVGYNLQPSRGKRGKAWRYAIPGCGIRKK